MKLWTVPIALTITLTVIAQVLAADGSAGMKSSRLPGKTLYGTLFQVEPYNYKLHSFPENNRWSEKARESITYPASANLRLDVAYEGAHKLKDLLPLSQNLVSIVALPENFDDDAMTQLEGFSNLQELDISNKDITDKGFHEVEKLKHLRILKASGMELTAAAVMNTKLPPNLDTLEIGKNLITDEPCKILASLKNLPFLSLSGAGITDAGIREISKLKSLDRLDIDINPKVTDKCIEYLAQMPNLKTLDVSRTGITEFKALARIAKLNHLIVRAKQQDASLADLQKARPHLEISVSSFRVEPTLFGPLH